MKNAMQLKAAIKMLAQEKHLSAQLVMQNYMLERLLERISLSPYRDNFILKGGLLIASMVGLHSRATMDMDSTIRNYPVNETTVREMFEVIIGIELEDDITFTLQRIGKIREKDEYDGYRVSLTANFAPMQIPLKLDVTTGDKITPAAIEYRYPLMFEDRELSIFAYNLETILAEKIETVISRGDQNTRPRDYYDIYILAELKGDSINMKLLQKALSATAQKRNTIDLMKQYGEIMLQVQASDVMQEYWRNYQRDFEYARYVDFPSVCETVKKICSLSLEKPKSP